MATSDISLSDDHKVVVGIMVLIVFTVIVTEVAGTSHGNAEVVILIMFGLLLILGIEHLSNFNGWAASNPFVPSPSAVATQQAVNQSAGY
jgi:hypothetical protein